MSTRIKAFLYLFILIAVCVALFFTYGYFKNNRSIQDYSNEEYKVSIKDKKFMQLPTLTLAQLEQKIKAKENMIVYLAWIYNCGDSRNFQSNLFDDYLNDGDLSNYDKFYVVNLDKEAPDALDNHDLREPITKALLIDTWTKDPDVSPMSLKAPQLIQYQNGKITNLVSWTPVNSDDVTGMQRSKVDAFFEAVRN